MTCFKCVVTATLVAPNGKRYVGKNDCNNPQNYCPRIAAGLVAGEGYQLCKDICEQPAHAEVRALDLAGAAASGSMMYIEGIDWICGVCIAACVAAGVKGLKIGSPPPEAPEDHFIWKGGSPTE